MKKIYTQPHIETVATTPQKMLCASGIKAQISGYKKDTGGGFSQTFVWLAGAVCSSLLFLGTACSTNNNPDQPKQQAELKPRTLIVTQQAVSKVTPASAVRRLPQATITENRNVLDALWDAGDEAAPLTIKVYDPTTGETITAQQTLTYTDDATLGTLAEPYIIQLQAGEGIENVQGNVQGIKVQKVFEDGILYILRNGEKYDATGKRVSEK